MDKQDAYQQKLEARLDRLAADIARLKARADEASAEAQLRFDEELEGLRRREAELHRRLAALKQAGDGAWEDLRGGVEHAWKDLSDAIERATKRFG